MNLYNYELKKRFLENYSDNTQRLYIDSLSQINDAEEEYNKDIFNFTIDELDSAFSGIRAKTIASVRRVISPVLKYIQWANQNGYINSKVDYTSIFTGEKLKKYVWKNAQINSYRTRTQIYEMCDEVANPIDKALIICPFEGIEGTEHFELTNLKKQDINFSTGEVKLKDKDGSERTITITDKRSLDILFEASNQNEYFTKNGESDTKNEGLRLLNDTPFIFRKIVLNESQFDDNMISKDCLVNRYTLLFKGLRNNGKLKLEPIVSNEPFLNSKNLLKSGYFDYCLNIEKKKGELQVSDFKDACVRYGKNPKIYANYKSEYPIYKELINNITK